MQKNIIEPLESQTNDSFDKLISDAIHQFKINQKLSTDVQLNHNFFHYKPNEKYFEITCIDAQVAANLHNYIENKYWLSKHVAASEIEHNKIICRGTMILYLERSFIWDKFIADAIAEKKWTNIFDWFFEDDALKKLAYTTKNKYLIKIKDRAIFFINKIESATENNANQVLIENSFNSALEKNKQLEQNRPSKTAEHKKRKLLDMSPTTSTPDDVTAPTSPPSSKVQRIDVQPSKSSTVSNKPPSSEDDNANTVSKKIHAQKQDLNTENLINLELIDLEIYEAEISSKTEKTIIDMEISQKQLFETALLIVKNEYTKLSNLYNKLMSLNVLMPEDKEKLQAITDIVVNFRSNPDNFALKYYENISSNLEDGIENIRKLIADLEAKTKQAELKSKLIYSIREKFSFYKECQNTLAKTKETEEKLKSKYAEETSNFGNTK